MISESFRFRDLICNDPRCADEQLNAGFDPSSPGSEWGTSTLYLALLDVASYQAHTVTVEQFRVLRRCLDLVVVSEQAVGGLTLFEVAATLRACPERQDFLQTILHRGGTCARRPWYDAAVTELLDRQRVQRRTARLKEELVRVAWAPRRVAAGWCLDTAEYREIFSAL